MISENVFSPSTWKKAKSPSGTMFISKKMGDLL